MTLIEGWKERWHKLWSIRLALASAFFGVLEIVLPQLQDVVPKWLFAMLSIACALWGAWARLVRQPAVIPEPQK